MQLQQHILQVATAGTGKNGKDMQATSAELLNL
jgi:hypothetical protein